MLWPARLANSMHWSKEVRSLGTLDHNHRVDLNEAAVSSGYVQDRWAIDRMERTSVNAQSVLPTSIILHPSSQG